MNFQTLVPTREAAKLIASVLVEYSSVDGGLMDDLCTSKALEGYYVSSVINIWRRATLLEMRKMFRGELPISRITVLLHYKYPKPNSLLAEEIINALKVKYLETVYL